MIYIVNLPEEKFEYVQIRYQLLFEQLSEKLKMRVGRYGRIKDKVLSTIGYLMLIYAVNYEYGINEELLFESNQHEKPFLSNYPEIYFNISHCDRCVAVGISSQQIGIDVQDYSAYSPQIHNDVCSKGEIDIIHSSAFPAESFMKFWTLKESYLKMIGCGLIDELAELDFSLNYGDNFNKYNSSFFIRKDKAYTLSICTREDMSKIIDLSDRIRW